MGKQIVAVVEKIKRVPPKPISMSTIRWFFTVMVRKMIGTLIYDIDYVLKYKLRNSEAFPWYQKFGEFVKYEGAQYEEEDRRTIFSGGVEYHCSCQLMSVFLGEEGFKFKQREGLEEFWILDT